MIRIESQAARGKDAYTADCAACHGEDLDADLTVLRQIKITPPR